VTIRRRPEQSFIVLVNLDRVQQAEDSPVGRARIYDLRLSWAGLQVPEVVRMLPFYKGEFITEITTFEPSCFWS